MASADLDELIESEVCDVRCRLCLWKSPKAKCRVGGGGGGAQPGQKIDMRRWRGICDLDWLSASLQPRGMQESSSDGWFYQVEDEKLRRNFKGTL